MSERSPRTVVRHVPPVISQAGLEQPGSPGNGSYPSRRVLLSFILVFDRQFGPVPALLAGAEPAAGTARDQPGAAESGTGGAVDRSCSTVRQLGAVARQQIVGAFYHARRPGAITKLTRGGHKRARPSCKNRFLR
jgi:hypothetical protein